MTEDWESNQQDVRVVYLMCDVRASLAVAEQRGTSQRPVFSRLNAPQPQREDEVQVGPTRLLVDRTRVQGDRPTTTTGGPLTVGHVG